MTKPDSASAPVADTAPRFLSFADQGMYLSNCAGNQQVIQLLWRYRRPVDLAALTRFRDHLAHGRLSQLIKPAKLAFGRHQWVRAPAPSLDLSGTTTPLGSTTMLDWADAQVERPLDPVRGPGWTLAAHTFTDGSTVISLVVSHCIADGMATALAVQEAARGVCVAPSTSPDSSAFQSVAREMRRFAQDMPATVRALAQLVRTIRIPRVLDKSEPGRRVVAAADDRRISFPSAFVRLPIAAWDAKARDLGANRFTLVAAVTAAFAEALGRVRGNDITLLVPVNERDGIADTGGNRVALATVKLPFDVWSGSLHAFKRRLQATLITTRREPDRLESLLPLVPFVPERAFSVASRIAIDALDDRPVTCSYIGEWPEDVLRADGGVADGFCFRGTDRQASLRAVEARQGVASVPACVIPGFMVLNFIAYQPGLVTQSTELRPLIEQILARFDLKGMFFDD